MNNNPKNTENINIQEENKIIFEKKDDITKGNDEKNLKNENNINVTEFKNKIVEKNDPNNYKEKVYLLIFVIFIIAIVIAIINYVKCNNNGKNNEDDLLQEKYENVINEKEEKDINNTKSSGQIIEMI